MVEQLSPLEEPKKNPVETPRTLIPQGFFKAQIRQKPNGRHVKLATIVGKAPSQEPLASGAWTAFLNELAQVYRDIFGRAPWHEYLRCTRDHDHPHKGIEQIFGTEKATRQALRQLEADTSAQEHPCPACSIDSIQHTLTPVYPIANLILSLRDAFGRSLNGTFLWEAPDKLFGFAYGWQGSWHDIWKQSIQPILEKEQANQKIENLGISHDQSLFYFAEWGIRQGQGDVADSLAMIRQLFETLLTNQALPAETPVIGYTRSQTMAHRLFLGLGGQDLFETQPDETVVSTIRLGAIVKRLRGLTPLQFALLGRRSKKP